MNRTLLLTLALLAISLPSLATPTPTPTHSSLLQPLLSKPLTQLDYKPMIATLHANPTKEQFTSVHHELAKYAITFRNDEVLERAKSRFDENLDRSADYFKGQYKLFKQYLPKKEKLDVTVFAKLMELFRHSEYPRLLTIHRYDPDGTLGSEAESLVALSYWGSTPTNLADFIKILDELVKGFIENQRRRELGYRMDILEYYLVKVAEIIWNSGKVSNPLDINWPELLQIELEANAVTFYDDKEKHTLGSNLKNAIQEYRKEATGEVPSGQNDYLSRFRFNGILW